MKKFKVMLFAVIIFSTACGRTDMWKKVSTDDAGSSSGGGTDTPLTEVVSVSPAGSGSAWLSGQPVAINNEIRIVFSKSMDTAVEPSFGGDRDMASASSGDWHTTNLTDDTLVITPSSPWTNTTTGTQLSVTCTSLEKDNVTLDLTYKISGSVYYVSPDAEASGTGTRTDPMNSLQTAVDAASAAGRPGVVLVSEGTFTTTDATLVNMAEGISLYGGYSASNWDVRDRALYITMLSDTRTMTESMHNINNPLRLVEFLSGITPVTVFDGFSLVIAPVSNGSMQPLPAAGIFINNGSPTITNVNITSPTISSSKSIAIMGICMVNGGNAKIGRSIITLGTTEGSNTGNVNHGIYCSNGPEPDIHDNNIDGGRSYTARGLNFNNCGGTIHNNPVINGGIAENDSSAIYLNNSSSFIINNTMITAESVSQAWGIKLWNSSHAQIKGNTIKNISAPMARGISITSQSRPVIFSNYIEPGNNTTSYGIQINNEDTGTVDYTRIYNNIIIGGNGSTTIGVYIYSINTRVNILNNTINGGGGNFAAGVYVRREENPGTDNSVNIVNNNIFSNKTTDGSYGIYEYTNIYSYPNMVANNNIFNCSVLYSDYSDRTGAVPLNDISEINSLLPDGITQANGNITDDIYSGLNIADQYRYTEDYSARPFASSGLDQGSIWDFHTDRDGITRTAPWSIGAYEYDSQ